MVCFTRYNSFREADLIAAAQKSNTYLTLAYAKILERDPDSTKIRVASL